MLKIEQGSIVEYYGYSFDGPQIHYPKTVGIITEILHDEHNCKVCQIQNYSDNCIDYIYMYNIERVLSIEEATLKRLER